jgi:hypothetical protein
VGSLKGSILSTPSLHSLTLVTLRRIITGVIWPTGNSLNGLHTSTSLGSIQYSSGYWAVYTGAYLQVFYSYSLFSGDGSGSDAGSNQVREGQDLSWVLGTPL